MHLCLFFELMTSMCLVSISIITDKHDESCCTTSGIASIHSGHCMLSLDLCTIPLGSDVRISNAYVTWSREMSHLSKKSISIFLYHCLPTSKCLILMQTPLQLDIRLQSYEESDNSKNNMKQRNLNPVLANISKTTSPTSDSFLVIMSHMVFKRCLSFSEGPFELDVHPGRCMDAMSDTGSTCNIPFK